VALVGKLEDIPPAEILMILSDSAKTGKLNLTTGTQEGMIVFRDGKIIYAASSSIRETFGSIALTLQVVNPEQLEEAVRLQYRSHEDKRLGEILVEIGAMTPSDVQRVLTHQVGQIVREIYEWKAGYFRFRNLEIEDAGEVEVDARDFIAGSPLDTRSVALDAAREQDESSRTAAPAGRGRGKASAASPPARAAAGAAPPALKTEPDGEAEAEHTTLARIMGDVASPALTAETIRDIFEAAAATLARGVIFAVRDRSIRGLAQYGLAEGDVPPSERVRKLLFASDEYSLISTVASLRKPFRGVPDHVRANTQLVRALGGEWPSEVVALPMLIGNRVALVFYGDNQPSGKPVGSTAVLEATLEAIGIRLATAR
jgi:hypothetical protein